MIQLKETIKDEISYTLYTPIEHRKKYAQFFTPPRVAILMSKWLVKNLSEKNKIKVLEPAIGFGIFSRMLRKLLSENAEIVGYDIDEKIISDANEVFLENKIIIKCHDYLQSEWTDKYDLIICNPPYFKFHDYDNIPLIKLVNSKLKSNLSGFTNLYALFILKSINQLNKNGCATYIVPSEFLNSDYGTEVKNQMIKSGALSDIVVFDFEENVFDNALTTACILFFRNKKNEVVNFYNVKSLTDLGNLEEDVLSEKHSNEVAKYTYHYHELKPALKWRNYYQNIKIDSLQNLVSAKKYCKVMRGIATGANDYFVFNKSKRKSFGIDEINLIPCITKGSDIPKLIFSETYFEELKERDKNLFLIDCSINQNNKIREYIQTGIDQKINERFLTKSRTPWYSLESKKVADIWVGVFNREGIKVILNKAKIFNLTTFHGIYINHNQRKYINAIFAFFQTDIAKRIFAVNSREYGNGLNKFEPNDFNNSMVFDFELLLEQEVEYLNDLVNNIEIAEKKDLSTEQILVEIGMFFERKIINC